MADDVAGTGGYGPYVANFGSYNKAYGALAGVIVFLLWLWITNLALLFGAELDAELERGRQLQAGMPAERGLQLPPATPASSRRTKPPRRRTSTAPGGCGAQVAGPASAYSRV